MKKGQIKSFISRKVLPKGFWTVFTVYIVSFILIFTALWGAQRQIFPDNEELATLRSTILTDPLSSDNYIKLGKYYFTHNQPKPAQNNFSLAAQLNPDSARNNYTLLVKNRVQLQKEATFWEKQLTKTPNFRDAHLKLAQIYYQLGKSAQATEHLSTAAKIDPNYPTLKGFAFQG